MPRRSKHSKRTATYPRTVTFKKAKAVHPRKPRVRKATIRF